MSKPLTMSEPIHIDFNLSHNGHSLFSNYEQDNPTIKKKSQHEAVIRALEASVYLWRNDSVDLLIQLATSFHALKALGQSQDIVGRVLNWFIEHGYLAKASRGNSLDGSISCFRVIQPFDLGEACILVNSLDRVIVKDSKGNPMSFAESQLAPIKANLSLINQHINNTTFKDHTGKQLPICLKRIFSHGSLMLHGRFYDHYMNIASIHRSAFTLDDVSTLVLDFRSMHPRLLYAIEGVSLTADPYSIDGVDRSEVKAVFTRMLNVTCVGALLASLKKEYASVNELAVLNVVRQIREKHQSIARYLFPAAKDSSLIAMYWESTLIETILLRSIEAGLVMLPIHDALIVKEPDEAQASLLIEQTFADLYPNIIIDSAFPLLKKESKSCVG